MATLLATPTATSVGQHSAAPLPGRVTRGITAATIILFWLAQFTLLTTQRFLFGADDDASYLLPRAVVAGAGIVLSFVIAAFHRRTRGISLTRRLGLAVAAGVIGALVHSLINFAVFHLFMPEKNWETAFIDTYVMAVVQWFWTYAALSALLLSVVYSGELRENERRVSQLQHDAHAAQLRALRYQLNPHFMFNTLNSIASLISVHEVGLAERMVENLSDFLRAGLALDPNEDIPLEREIELQTLYLSIEAVRFPDRLRVKIDVPDEANEAMVPSLIIQPLVENAIRHAVATSTAPVTVTIAAEVVGDRLKVAVLNSGGDGGGKRNGQLTGTSVGLNNVAERLSARYDSPCDFSAATAPDGGFAVRFSIPFHRANT